MSDWQITGINTGDFLLDGGAMFGIIPKPLWEKAYPADVQNRIRMRTHCMLLQGFGKNVIIETGNGDGFSDKERAFYGMSTYVSWRQLLKPHGLTPEQITDVILTHLHFDHAGGLSHKLADGTLALTFPNAIHYVQREQKEWALKPSERDAGSYRKEGLHPFISDAAKVHYLDGNVEILPGISAQTIHGHSPAQQLIHIKSQTRHLVFVADLTPTSAHLHLPWIMGYDLWPLKTLQEKKDFLAHAVQDKWQLWLYHDAHHPCVTVKYDGKRYQMDKEINF